MASLCGKTFIKNFPGYGRYQGTVTSYDRERDSFGVHYADGDQRTMKRTELERLLAREQPAKKSKSTSSSSLRSTPKRKRKDPRAAGIQLPSKKTKKQLQQKKSASSSSSSSAPSGPSTQKQLKLDFARFCWRRMLVNVEMHKTEVVNRDGATFDGPFEIPRSTTIMDKVCECSTFGNCYRHLDTPTHALGSAIIGKAVAHGAGEDPSQWGDVELGEAIMVCLMQMAMFREDRCEEGCRRVGGVDLSKGPTGKAVDAAARLPSRPEEIQAMIKWLRKDGLGNGAVFHAKNQNQGLRWVQNRWLQDSYLARGEDFVISNKTKKQQLHVKGGESPLTAAARVVRNAGSWADAVDTLQVLPGVGAYTGAQAMCSVFYGIYKGRAGLFAHHDEVIASMNRETRAGPGPLQMIGSMFPGGGGGKKNQKNQKDKKNKKNQKDKKNKKKAGAAAAAAAAAEKEELKGGTFDVNLRQLASEMDGLFDELGLNFPYLKAEDGQSARRLSCVDLEHELCYFHRYDNAKTRMKKAGVDHLYDRYNEEVENKAGERVPFRKLVKRQAIKSWSVQKNQSVSSIDACCDKLLEAAGGRRIVEERAV